MKNKVAVEVLRSRNKQLETTNNENFWSQGMVVRDIVDAMEEQAIRFSDWINRNGYEPMSIFPIKTNKNWSCDDGMTTKTTKQLYEEFNCEG